MQRLFPIVLLLLLVLQSGLRTAMVFHFTLNQRQITLSYCENKDRPELKCEGKCYLEKKLKQAEQDNHIPDILKTHTDEYMAEQKKFSMPVVQKNNVHPAGATGDCLHGNLRDVFRPPCVRMV